MHGHQLPILVVVLALSLFAAMPAAAQAPRHGPVAAVTLPARWTPASPVFASTQRGDSLVALPVRAGKSRKYTIIGAAVGAGVGGLAGFLLYNAFCEAVDNRCRESRTGYVVVVGVLGGGLGALVGSIAD